MKKMKLCFVIALTLLLSLCGCAGEKPGGASTGEASSPVEYTVTLTTQGGMALSGIDVYIYSDEAIHTLECFGQTDETGAVKLTMPEQEGYRAVLSGVPEGYHVEASYPVENPVTELVLTSELRKGESLSNVSLGLGDVMYDFSVTTPGGETVTLSELLQEKEMVLLNFWYTTCTYCVQEFPFMEQVYQEYQDKVGIIALNPLEQDAAVASFQSQYGLSFPMASCPSAWAAAFGVSGYPTSVVVDRYGVICLVEAGGILSRRPFTAMFDHFTGEDYQQRLVTSLSELITNVKPNVTMSDPADIAQAINVGDIQAAYRPEEGKDAEYSWPFVVTEKNGASCIMTTNQEVEGSYAILYCDVALKAGQAIGFDYLTSTERGADILHVIVNDEPVFAISGYHMEERWERCYPWVAQEDGVYEVALCYMKDSDSNHAEDTVYIDNLRVVEADEIDVATYIPQYAAKELEGESYTYVDVVLNEKDGYYHVGSADGPLLLADLMGYTQFNEEKTVWELVYNEEATYQGAGFYEDMVSYFSYASNSAINGVCTVNRELGEWLKRIADSVGFTEDENEWLQICRYYEVYGPDAGQLTDPIKGLATFSAYAAHLGGGNSFYYDRPIMPRGLLARFVPSKSGVYRITSLLDSEQGAEGWIFTYDQVTGTRDGGYTYEQVERLNDDPMNVSMVYYMEAGKEYYIDIAFWDIYATGSIDYKIEYVGREYDLFRLGSPGYFTYDTNATGELMYALISGGVKVVLGEDGYYHEDLGLDEQGKQRYGSILYCDFTGVTGLFNLPLADVPAYHEDGTLSLDENGDPVMIRGMISLGGFDFSKTENDLYILNIMASHDNDAEATDAYLHTYWGEDYDEYAELYQVEDVYAGKYHGTGGDHTGEIEAYLSRIITSGKEERIGCVPVDEALAELLQMLMDKYTFSGVEHSWTKLCYYYQHLGA